MPTISEFFGILIRMYYDDHNPHFHVYDGAHEAVIAIDTLAVMEGSLPGKPTPLCLNGPRNIARNCWRIGA
jgi:hypothetical protein